jgi:hypothetical protein
MSTATNIDTSKAAQANTYNESSASNASDLRKQPESKTVEGDVSEVGTEMGSKVIKDKKEGIEAETNRFAKPGMQKPVGEL